MKDHQDALGHAMYDRLIGKGGFEIIERNDGFFDASVGPSAYFSEYESWPERQKKALALASGRVLDIGCGAGRHALYLQKKGFDVLGIDVSPLAIEVCRQRRLKQAEVMSVTQLSSRLGKFDTIVMFGNNFGLVGSYAGGKRLLKRFGTLTSDEALILAENQDPYTTTEPLHLEYQERNRQRGRMGGQNRIRVRYKKYVTPWFDYLRASRAEMQDIVDGTGWRIAEFIDDGAHQYVALLRKDLGTGWAGTSDA